MTAAFLLALTTVTAEKITIDANAVKSKYTEKLTITPTDKTVKIEGDVITITAKKEDTTYVISGYFNGQIINKTKNTVLKFKDAYIENTQGQPAIYGEAKTEISTVQGTTSYIVSSGSSSSKVGAIHCKKNLEIGGSGTLYVVGQVRHGIKGDDVKLKGSGTLYAQGTEKGSAINCRSLLSEREKTFKAYLINSKNGVKADNTISIASGNFYIYNNGTGLKTDTKQDDPGNPHSIKLLGGNIHTSANEALYETEQNAWTVKGAKMIEE